MASIQALRGSIKQWHGLGRTVVLAIALGVGISLTACGKQSATSPANAPSAASVASSAPQGETSTVVRIGYQKYGTLALLKARGELEQEFKAQGVSVQWVQFPGGPQLLEALNTGNLDFGNTGETPPIFAQAAGAPLLYIANELPDPKGEAILVKQDAALKTVADLKGKKVVLNKGSNVHYLLVRALEDAGLKYTDVKTIFLPPADARAVFEKGDADAWVIWDPYLTAAKRSLNARILKDADGLAPNRQFYLAAKPFSEKYPERVKAIITSLEKTGEWAKANPNEVAKILSPQLGIDEPTLQEIAQHLPYGIQLIKPNVIADQQKIADTFYELKLLPKPVEVKTVAQITK
ncbi:sulfonate ABC transporter substrate-binding protein [Phormidium sp. FACHB-592]|uniref:Sulfonate ABC transporter substrate-binding protein n=1 Tax=Stenomitos frigidus AS-A4 TaxID=2933935 RepID=A0ABV0KL26_9CYAN|nr:sulfonate ABC transporter substrate-binding protein [Phormidium sp. FACHB-592]MBD2075678.1 sulfonate ABC transporter substrate-binding protein [Phormidium sp. FACHB-592]